MKGWSLKVGRSLRDEVEGGLTMGGVDTPLKQGAKVGRIE